MVDDPAGEMHVFVIDSMLPASTLPRYPLLLPRILHRTDLRGNWRYTVPIQTGGNPDCRSSSPHSNLLHNPTPRILTEAAPLIPAPTVYAQVLREDPRVLHGLVSILAPTVYARVLGK